MKARPLVLLFLALSGVLVAPRLVYAQLPSSPKPLTITEAYCVAQPLALAWDANALPASFKGDSPDEQLRSRTWTIFFSPQGRSGLILSVTVQDGVPSASQLRG